MIKNILVSVSDKVGLVDLLKPLVREGAQIVSTGGTAKHLMDAGFKVKDISELTGFPEVMGGRVKTLHPKVYMSLLAREWVPGDQEILKEQGLEYFDLVICNLYPFEQTLKAQASQLNKKELIEQIDIGGPTLLRAAAKNFSRVAVLCNPSDYQWFLNHKDSLSFEKRQLLASKVFFHVSAYDSLIAQTLSTLEMPQNIENQETKDWSLGGTVVQTLRYGENPHQTAQWIAAKGARGLQDAEVLQGKVLSYNNILDLEAAWKLVRLFKNPGSVVVKHNNPCGAAEVKNNIEEALNLSLAADPVSAFGGIVVLNRSVNAAMAHRLSEIFLECIMAPDFTEDALSVFDKKKNLRLLKWKDLMETPIGGEVKSVTGGFLLQSADINFDENLVSGHWTFVGEKPSESLMLDLQFGEKVCASLKSNAICIVAQGKTLGMGMGQVNRVDAVQQAIERMKKHHGPQKDMILVSDAFFPFKDSVELAHQAGVKWILQPGGSVKDNEVIEAAKSFNINMILTNVRHFKH
jgi:phosphoribosylaminoimidazolecarboxamide formyltransferase/IMP cyclohydrolase